MESVNWYAWPTQQAFDLWHQIVIDAMNLPRVGFNQATGEPQPDKTQTTAYTAVVFVADGDWRAMVEDDVATQFKSGIGTPCDSPPVTELDE